MHLVLAMCDANIVIVLLCLKVNSCQSIEQNSLNMHTRVRDDGKTYRNIFQSRGEIVKYEDFSQRLCVTARSCTQFDHNENSPLFNQSSCLSTIMIAACHLSQSILNGTISKYAIEHNTYASIIRGCVCVY